MFRSFSLAVLGILFASSLRADDGFGAASAMRFQNGHWTTSANVNFGSGYGTTSMTSNSQNFAHSRGVEWTGNGLRIGHSFTYRMPDGSLSSRSVLFGEGSQYGASNAGVSGDGSRHAGSSGFITPDRSMIFTNQAGSLMGMPTWTSMQARN